MQKNITLQFLIGCLVFLLTTNCYCQVLQVPTQYTTIQQAINQADYGDTILVAPGTYYENINYKGKCIIIASHFINNHDINTIKQTIINGSTPTNPDTASCVLITRNDTNYVHDTTPALIGFTLTKGTGTKWQDEHGAGKYREGGGILIQYMSPRIMFNIIDSNYATNKTGCTSAGGGGIRCGDGNPCIQNNFLYHNQGRYGGGIVINYSGCTIRNNVIAYNNGGSEFGGGGIWCYGNDSWSRPRIIENNHIINNVVTNNSGGGIYAYIEVTLRNNIIWGNKATGGSGPQIYKRTTGSYVINYNNIQGGGFSGVGNINIYPSLDDSGFYLLPASPCIDAGDTNALYNDKPDAGNPSFAAFPSMGSLRNDMGAFGGPYASKIWDSVFVNTNIAELNANNKSITYQITPNPVSGNFATLINPFFQAIESIAIFNTLGQYKKNVSFNSNSSDKITIDLGNIETGMYFIIVKSKNKSQVLKLIKE